MHRESVTGSEGKGKAKIRANIPEIDQAKSEMGCGTEMTNRQEFDASKRPPVDISDEDFEKAFKNA